MNNVHIIASNWFVNHFPLVTRLPRVHVEATTFQTAGTSQFCETWNRPIPDSRANSSPQPYPTNQLGALQGVLADMETTSYYGAGIDPLVGVRPRQKGLRTLLQTNKVLAPRNAAAYELGEFIDNTLVAVKARGGNPDVLLISQRFLEAWGLTIQRIDAGVNVYGVPIDAFQCPALEGVTVIESRLLRGNTAVCLTSAEVRMRMKRNEFWSPRARRSYVGDFIAEGAIEVDNESHHAWVEGITGFKGENDGSMFEGW